MVKIVGTLLLIVGIVGIMVFGSRINFKLKIPKPEPYHAEQQISSKEVQKLKINPGESDLQIVLVDEGDLRVVFDGYRMKHEQIKLVVQKQKNQALVDLQQSTTSKSILHLLPFMQFNHPNNQLVVYLPKQKYEQIQIDDGLGEILANDITDIKDFTINSHFGYIQMENFKGRQISIQKSDGTVELNKIQANLAIDTDYGDISGGEWKGSLIDLHTENGNINVNRVDGKIVAESSTGDIKLKQLIGNYDYQITNQMGSVTLSYLTPPTQVQFDLTSEFGKARLNLPSAMQSVNHNQNDSMESGEQVKGFVGKSGEGPFLRVNTETGDIQI